MKNYLLMDKSVENELKQFVEERLQADVEFIGNVSALLEHKGVLKDGVLLYRALKGSHPFVTKKVLIEYFLSEPLCLTSHVAELVFEFMDADEDGAISEKEFVDILMLPQIRTLTEEESIQYSHRSQRDMEEIKSILDEIMLVLVDHLIHLEIIKTALCRVPGFSLSQIFTYLTSLPNHNLRSSYQKDSESDYISIDQLALFLKGSICADNLNFLYQSLAREGGQRDHEMPSSSRSDYSARVLTLKALRRVLTTSPVNALLGIPQMTKENTESGWEELIELVKNSNKSKLTLFIEKEEETPRKISYSVEVYAGRYQKGDDDVKNSPNQAASTRNATPVYNYNQRSRHESIDNKYKGYANDHDYRSREHISSFDHRAVSMNRSPYEGKRYQPYIVNKHTDKIYCYEVQHGRPKQQLTVQNKQKTHSLHSKQVQPALSTPVRPPATSFTSPPGVHRNPHSKELDSQQLTFKNKSSNHYATPSLPNQRIPATTYTASSHSSSSNNKDKYRHNASCSIYITPLNKVGSVDYRGYLDAPAKTQAGF